MTNHTMRAVRRQAKAQLAPPTASFEGKTVIIIGATGVMCSEAARIFAQLRVGKLVFGVRNVNKARGLADEIASQHGLDRERISIEQIDLTSFDSVKAFVANLQSLHRLDVLLIGSATNNTKRFVTPDGWEENLQVIHLSCALLVMLFLPKLQRSAEVHHAPAVISNVSSFAVRVSEPMLKFPDKLSAGGYLKDASDGKIIFTLAQYALCKMASYVWFEALSSFLDPDQVRVQSLDPGVTKSPLSTNSVFAKAALRLFGRSPVICGRAIVNACSPIENAHGAMLLDYEVEKPTSYMTSKRTRKMRRVIWDETRAVLEKLSPDVSQVYADLDEKSGGVYTDRYDIVKG